MKVRDGRIFYDDWWDVAAFDRPEGRLAKLFLSHMKEFQQLCCHDADEFETAILPKLVEEALYRQKLSIEQLDGLVREVMEELHEYALDDIFKLMRALLLEQNLLNQWKPTVPEFNPHPPLTGQTPKPGSHNSIK